MFLVKSGQVVLEMVGGGGGVENYNGTCTSISTVINETKRLNQKKNNIYEPLVQKCSISQLEKK